MTARTPSQVASFAEILISGDRKAAHGFVDDVSVGDSPTLYGELFAPAMREVGERWASGVISVAQEHVATGLMEELLARDYACVFVRERASRETVLMACVEHERHVLGLRMAANLLEGAGFHLVFLGADCPAEEIAAPARSHRAAVVVLAGYGEGRVGALRAAAEAVRSALPQVAILLGGSAASLYASQARTVEVIEARAIPDVVDAVERALRLTPVDRAGR